MSMRLLFAVAVLAAAVLPAQDSVHTIRGKLVYLQRMGLPRDVNVVVSLLDAAEPGVVIAQAAWRSEHQQIPIPFELRFPIRAVSPRHRYELRAEIRIRGEAWFTGVLALAGDELRQTRKQLVITLKPTS